MTCKTRSQPAWFRRLILWIATFVESKPFRPLGLNRPNRPNIELNKPTENRPKGYPIGSPASGCSWQRLEIQPLENNETLGSSEQCNNNLPTKTQCAYCDGSLGSFSESLTKRITKVFEFCTGCGLVVKVKLYHD